MAQRQKLVLVANDVGGSGGMETHLEELIERLRHKYQLTVISSSLRLHDATGIRHIRVPVIRRPFPLMSVMFSIYVSLRLMRLRKDSIVHTTGAIVLCKADVSTVHFCHAGWRSAVKEGERARPSLLYKLNHGLSTRMKLWFERHCYQPGRTKRLVAVSERVALELLHHYPYPGSSISVISNGVDTNRFRPATLQQKHVLRAELNLPVDGTYAVFVGGDWERKGVRYLLEAFGQLASEYSQLHILIVGNGDVEVFGRMVPDAFRDRIHFAGRQSNPETWYRLSDIFVFPSNYEACSLAVLEAAASGLAMILTRVGGAEDLVKDGLSGFLVDRASGSIADRLRFLLNNPKKVEQLARAVRKRVEKLTWDETCRQFEELYDRVGIQGNAQPLSSDNTWLLEEEALK